MKFLATLLLLAFPFLAPAQMRVTSVEGITEYKLDNGLRVLLFPDPTKSTVTVNITYLVGSRNENYGESGMAHLLEHMVFKGTPKHPDIPKELSNHGARPNGSTSYDRTNYFETFAATDENLRWALDLESDRMVNSYIAKKDLDSEMTVVRNEFESGENSPGRVLMQRVLAVAYDWHNYGKETIGPKADLENVPIDRLQAFYKTYYQPDNAVLMVAGKIDEPATLRLVNDHFGKIPRPTRKLQVTYTRDPVQDGERMVTVRRVGDTQFADLVYHIPDGANPDLPAIEVFTELMRRPPSGRLYKALVETKKAANASAFEFQLREPGTIIFQAQVRKDANLDDARDTLIKTVEEFSSTPATKEEVDRAKADLLKQIDLALNDSGRIGLILSETIAGGDWRLFFLDRDRIRDVTPGDVMRVAKTYLKPSNRTLGLFIPTDKPDRAEIAPQSDLAAMLKDYKGGEAIAQGEAFDPSPGNIDKRTARGALGNGMKLVMLSKKTRGNNVEVQITLHMGDLASLKDRNAAPGMTANMLMRGTTKHTRQQITDELNRLKARVNAGGGGTQVRASIETTRQNLPEVMKLVAEILREPAFPQAEFDQLKEQQLAGVEAMRREPNAVASVAINQHLNPYPLGDPRHVLSPDENAARIKSTTLDDVRKFYQDFYGASNGELVIVGDFDAEQAQKIASDLFGSWKSPHSYTRIPMPYVKVPATDQSIKTPDKANAMIVAGIPLDISDRHPDYPALVMGNYILGSGMNSRLFQRIRGKEGLSYGVGSTLFGRAEDDSGSFMAQAIFAPQNAEKVEAALKEEIARMVKEGPSEAELAEAKKGYLQGRTVSRAQDPELAAAMSANAFEDRTMAFQAELEQKIAALTPRQIAEALQRHLDPSQVSFVKAGDFKDSH